MMVPLSYSNSTMLLSTNRSVVMLLIFQHRQERAAREIVTCGSLAPGAGFNEHLPGHDGY